MNRYFFMKKKEKGFNFTIYIYFVVVVVNICGVCVHSCCCVVVSNSL